MIEFIIGYLLGKSLSKKEDYEDETELICSDKPVNIDDGDFV